MLSLEESLKILKETNALLEGHFILSSGLHSPQYVQCAQLMSKPKQALKICESLADKIKVEFKDFDLILSPAMGGIIVGYELGKILTINYGHKLSRQYHKEKEETIFVLTGTLLLEVGMGSKLEKIELRKGQSFHITPGTIHRFCAPYGDVELTEVSTPELKDVVRLDDDYNRS